MGKWSRKTSLTNERPSTNGVLKYDARLYISISCSETRRLICYLIVAALKIAKLRKQWIQKTSAKGRLQEKGWLGEGIRWRIKQVILWKTLDASFCRIEKPFKLKFTMRSRDSLFLSIVAYTIRQCATTLWKFRVLLMPANERYSLYLKVKC